MQTNFTLSLTQTMGHRCSIYLEDKTEGYTFIDEPALKDKRDIAISFFVPLSMMNPSVTATCMNANGEYDS